MNTMYDYIYSKEKILNEILENFDFTYPKKFSRLFIVGCGSSFNSGKIVEPFALDYGLAVSVMHPLEFISTQKNISADDLVIFISQMGNSALVVDAMRAVKGKCTTLGLTAFSDTPLAMEADHFINIGCGEENWNAKSKGVSATVLNLLLFVLRYARDNGLISECRYKEDIDKIKAVIGNLEFFTKELDGQADMLVNILEQDSTLWILATGNQYPVTREFAMKVIECSYVKSAYKEMEEFLHGFEMCAGHRDVFALVALDEFSRKIAPGLKRFLADNGITDKVLIISGKDGDIRTSVPDTPFNIFVGLVLLQLVAYKAGLKFGIDSRRTRYPNINKYVETKL